MRLKGAIFDVDGTLLDSMSIWYSLGEEYVRQQGKTPKPDLREQLWSRSLYDAAIYLQEEYGIEESIYDIMAGIDGSVERFYKEKVPLKSGAFELVKTLYEASVRMCIATATDRPFIEAALSRVGILPYFSGIFTTSEVGVGKTHPKIYRRALHLLGTRKSETLVFEDALYAVQTAKRAGFKVVGVREETEEGRDDVRVLSDFYLDDLKDTSSLLDAVTF